jgi:hypothetical protein
MLANKATFRNCLVIMRPKTTARDLPSTNDVRIHLWNSFIRHLDQLQRDIEVSLLRIRKRLHSQARSPNIYSLVIRIPWERFQQLLMAGPPIPHNKVIWA